jgi:acyl-CoA thioesterase-1
MYRPAQTNLHRCSWIPLLIYTLIASACGGSGAVGSTVHSTTATQVVTVQPALKVHLPSGPIIYVALGASDAVGIGSNQPGSQGYVPLIAAHLVKGSHAINLGISGIRLHRALTQELPLTLTISPDLVTIWLVANDFVGGVPYDDYMRDLNTFLQQLRSDTHAFIVMANLPDLTRLPIFANQTPTQRIRMLLAIQHWNAGIATLAARYGVKVVDLFNHQSQLTAHPEYVSSDGFHPSPLGYVQLANIFWQAIQG